MVLVLGLLLIPSLVESSSGIEVVDKTGDGIWDVNTWQVNIYPGEVKSTTISLYNSYGGSREVEVSVLSDSLDDGNLAFELDKTSFTMPGNSDADVTLTVRASGSTTPGSYTAELEIVSEVPPIPAPALLGGGGGINNPPGNPLYVIIEVTWDGDPAHNGDWTVWGPKWNPEVGTGTILTSCTDCLEMNYEFQFKGKTLQFDEVYVPGVDASPQIHHVVLKDSDGDGIYTGSLSAAKYIWGGAAPSSTLYHDRIDYDVTVTDGQVTNFHYLEYEHKKLK